MNKRTGFTPLEIKISNGVSKRFLTGFTLMELLVVIAIVALLTSILVPALNKAKAGAKDLLCTSRLRELGSIWKMYTDENDGRFMKRGCGSSRGAVTWFHSIRRYYSNLEMLVYPLAVKTHQEGARNPYAA